jgi:pilus assembly protein CpaB
MKPKTMILLVVAMGCGLTASYMTSRLIAERNGGLTDGAKKAVLVAKKKIPQWMQIKKPEDYFEIKDLSADAVTKTTLTAFDQIKDKRLNRNLPEGEKVSEEDLLNKSLDGLAAEIRPGSRAVGIKVTPESLAGGFVLPNSHVDVMLIIRRGDQDSSAQILLQDMLVLAVDTNAERNTEKGITMLGNTVTLAVKPEEALRLNLAQAVGDLRLVLRPLGEEAPITLKPIKVEDFAKPLQDTTDGAKKTDDEVVQGGDKNPLPPVDLGKEPLPTEGRAPQEDLRPLKTHTLTIDIAGSVQKERYTFDGKDGWTKGVTKSQPDDNPPVKRAPAPAPVPEVKKDKEKDKDKDTNPAPAQPAQGGNRTPGTRTTTKG